MKVPRDKARQAIGAVTLVIRAFLLILVFAVGGGTSADAHTQHTGTFAPETAVAHTPHDTCCHGDTGEVAMTTCAASTCCPAVSSTELTALAVVVLQNRAIRAPHSRLRHGIKTLPLIQPPILS